MAGVRPAVRTGRGGYRELTVKGTRPGRPADAVLEIL
jgi:hypothetical protein